MSINETTSFDLILERFYDRIEKDEDFFNYYNIHISEAEKIARMRSVNYLIEALDYMSSIGELQVDFSNYDSELNRVNFKLVNKELNILSELMFLIYMKRDEALLHAMKINFTPSDLNVLSPANERTSYRNFIRDLSLNIETMIDNYKNRDRFTGALKVVIDYSSYSEA